MSLSGEKLHNHIKELLAEIQTRDNDIKLLRRAVELHWACEHDKKNIRAELAAEIARLSGIKDNAV